MKPHSLYKICHACLCCRPPAPVCAPRDYVQTLVHITMELCKFRGAIVG